MNNIWHKHCSDNRCIETLTFKQCYKHWEFENTIKTKQNRHNVDKNLCFGSNTEKLCVTLVWVWTNNMDSFDWFFKSTDSFDRFKELFFSKEYFGTVTAAQHQRLTQLTLQNNICDQVCPLVYYEGSKISIER